MLGIGAALLGVGIDFVKDLIVDNGEDLVKEGIKKVTGIDLNEKKVQELTPEEINLINSHKLNIMKLDFDKLNLEFLKDKEKNRHKEALFTTSHSTYNNNNSSMADKIAKQIIERNLPIIAILVTINVSLIHFMQENAALIAIASSIIGGAVGYLFAERQAVINFFFGSSVGSKEKQKKIEETKWIFYYL